MKSDELYPAYGVRSVQTGFSARIRYQHPCKRLMVPSMPCFFTNHRRGTLSSRSAKRQAFEPPRRSQSLPYPAAFFSWGKLKIAQQWIVSYECPIRFQLETLLRSGLAHTHDLVAVCQPVETFIRTDDIGFAADFMRRFVEKLCSKSNGEILVEWFRNALNEEWRDVHVCIVDPDDSCWLGETSMVGGMS